MRLELISIEAAIDEKEIQFCTVSFSQQAGLNGENVSLMCIGSERNGQIPPLQLIVDDGGKRHATVAELRLLGYKHPVVHEDLIKFGGRET